MSDTKPRAAHSTAAETESVSVPMLDVNRQNEPLREEILAAIARVYDSGRFLFGQECLELESLIAEYSQTKHAIGCASGSDALLLALMALDIGPGDEVILPSFTFFATAGAVARLGATPVFIDIDLATYNLDVSALPDKITSATKAIIPVHLFGACADMPMICAIADQYGVAVIEDAAQAIGAELQGRRAGGMGLMGCFSFYPTKNLGGMGDGGMLVTNDSELAAKLRVLRDHGQQPRYHHSLIGLNSRLDTLQAAGLTVKMRHLDRWVARRTRNAERYAELFTETGLDRRLFLPFSASGARHVWNQYTVRVPNNQRDALVAHLTQNQIGAAIYYPIPLHLQPCFRHLGYTAGSLPNTELAAREVLSLPIFAELTDAELQSVVHHIAGFFAQQDANPSLVKRPKSFDQTKKRNTAA